MKRALVFALLLSVPLAAIPLWWGMRTDAASSNHFQHYQLTAAWEQSSGCLKTKTQLYVLTGSDQHGNGRAHAVAEAHALVGQFDTCTGKSTIEAEGSAQLQKSDFKIQGNLRSASLNTTIRIVDEDTNQGSDLAVSATWTNVGAPKQAKGRVKVPGADAAITSDVVGQQASATGTIRLGGTTLASGTASFADLGLMQDPSATPAP